MSSSPLQEAVAAMTSGVNLFDVVIICTTDDYQADFWMNRLSTGLCSSSKMVLACSEDWNDSGGAGNGLGTLYAYEKACKLAKEKYGMDLKDLLSKKEVSAALYHTAGKGTRMAPLPASENNNKPGVKLPILLTKADGSTAPITVLEAVIQQTGVYAKSRKGRVSVFWGDQVFLPSASFQEEPTHHIDIMCTLLGDTAPTAEEWTAQGLEKYGVIAVLDSGNAAQVEKVSHGTAVKMLETLGNIRQVGPSLGSFSVSASILKSLCDEYSTELTEKTAKLDTDPHFWMPLTLPKTEYASLMAQKGIDEQISNKHHDRMSAFSKTLDLSTMGLFGAVDVGKDACWWDYGQLKLYSKNNLKLLEDGEDAQFLRQFMSLTDKKAHSSLSDAVTIDESSCATGCQISQGGSIQKSVLCNVTAQTVETNGAIIVNCVAPSITAGEGAILYNLVSPDTPIVAAAGSVQVAVTSEDDNESLVLQSRMDIDGGKAWKVKIEDLNDVSFESVFMKNKMANVGAIEAKRENLYKEAASKILS
eukprot:CAMPEP_0178913052 /NCGR_PEP_ID=MMETSP0786-20121207/10620_1 /TAXON_ID=186022 /ORGANISM="Thalassionema frauenfeldii, Strain CCMP 1798" /LENGTH=530 /DNA_ID=CAMNT_0020585735 /DNA_START=70 /DNA_END=1662 /DNA_ORIENTATION=+